MAGGVRARPATATTSAATTTTRSSAEKALRRAVDVGCFLTVILIAAGAQLALQPAESVPDAARSWWGHAGAEVSSNPEPPNAGAPPSAWSSWSALWNELTGGQQEDADNTAPMGTESAAGQAPVASNYNPPPAAASDIAREKTQGRSLAIEVFPPLDGMVPETDREMEEAAEKWKRAAWDWWQNAAASAGATWTSGANKDSNVVRGPMWMSSSEWDQDGSVEGAPSWGPVWATTDDYNPADEGDGAMVNYLRGMWDWSGLYEKNDAYERNPSVPAYSARTVAGGPPAAANRPSKPSKPSKPDQSPLPTRDAVPEPWEAEEGEGAAVQYLRKLWGWPDAGDTVATTDEYGMPQESQDYEPMVDFQFGDESAAWEDWEGASYPTFEDQYEAGTWDEVPDQEYEAPPARHQRQRPVVEAARRPAQPNRQAHVRTEPTRQAHSRTEPARKNSEGNTESTRKAHGRTDRAQHSKGASGGAQKQRSLLGSLLGSIMVEDLGGDSAGYGHDKWMPEDLRDGDVDRPWGGYGVDSGSTVARKPRGGGRAAVRRDDDEDDESDSSEGLWDRLRAAFAPGPAAVEDDVEYYDEDSEGEDEYAIADDVEGDYDADDESPSGSGWSLAALFDTLAAARQGADDPDEPVPARRTESKSAKKKSTPSRNIDDEESVGASGGSSWWSSFLVDDLSANTAGTARGKKRETSHKTSVTRGRKEDIDDEDDGDSLGGLWGFLQSFGGNDDEDEVGGSVRPSKSGRRAKKPSDSKTIKPRTAANKVRKPSVSDDNEEDDESRGSWGIFNLLGRGSEVDDTEDVAEDNDDDAEGSRAISDWVADILGGGRLARQAARAVFDVEATRPEMPQSVLVNDLGGASSVKKQKTMKERQEDLKARAKREKAASAAAEAARTKVIKQAEDDDASTRVEPQSAAASLADDPAELEKIIHDVVLQVLAARMRSGGDTTVHHLLHDTPAGLRQLGNLGTATAPSRPIAPAFAPPPAAAQYGSGAYRPPSPQTQQGIATSPNPTAKSVLDALASVFDVSGPVDVPSGIFVGDLAAAEPRVAVQPQQQQTAGGAAGTGFHLRFLDDLRRALAAPADGTVGAQAPAAAVTADWAAKLPVDGLIGALASIFDVSGPVEAPSSILVEDLADRAADAAAASRAWPAAWPAASVRAPVAPAAQAYYAMQQQSPLAPSPVHAPLAPPAAQAHPAAGSSPLDDLLGAFASVFDVSGPVDKPTGLTVDDLRLGGAGRKPSAPATSPAAPRAAAPAAPASAAAPAAGLLQDLVAQLGAAFDLRGDGPTGAQQEQPGSVLVDGLAAGSPSPRRGRQPAKAKARRGVADSDGGFAGAVGREAGRAGRRALEGLVGALAGVFDVNGEVERPAGLFVEDLKVTGSGRGRRSKGSGGGRRAGTKDAKRGKKERRGGR